MAYVRVLALIDDLRRLPAETAWVESWETGIARQFIDAGEVLDLLDHASCFELTRAPRPDSRESAWQACNANA